MNDELDELLNKNQDSSENSGSENPAAAVSDADKSQNEEIFSSVPDENELISDFEKLNFEFFGDLIEEFEPVELPEDNSESIEEQPSQENSSAEPAAKKAVNSALVINVRNEKPQKGKKPKKQKKPKKSKEPKEEISEPLPVLLYKAIYAFGFSVINYSKAISILSARTVSKPFIAFFKALNAGKEEKDSTLRSSISDFLGEFTSFHDDSTVARQAFRKVYRDPERLKEAVNLYISYIKKNYRHVLLTLTNTLLPIAAALVLVFTSTYWNDLTFAIGVTYNGLDLGYISDESVYIEAQDLIGEKLGTGAYSFENGGSDLYSSLDAEYKLKLISLEKLNDAETICDKVIENSAENLTNACGIYIDNEFIGAVKNEADAKTVFYNYLKPYSEEAKKEGYVVGFAENVEYRQGIYSDSEEIMIDANRLNEIIHTQKTVIGEYTCGENDTLETISLASGIPEERLKELNPDFRWSQIKPGDKINYETKTNRLRIQKTIITTETVDIPYDTQLNTDPTKYAGYSQVTREGVNGKQKIVTTRVFVEGVKTLDNVEKKVIKKPVSEIKTVGGMSYFGVVVNSNVSAYGFLWPAPSCNNISSPYGYRSSGFHNGVDLYIAGGGAIGTSVVASRDGIVEYAGWNDHGYGYMVLINHGDGFKTRYGHMLPGSLCVSAGDFVYAGQQVGRIGSTGNSTGPHLHFEVIYYGDTINPMDVLSR